MCGKYVFIPAGILAKTNANWAEVTHLKPEKLAELNWKGFFINNLFPVTLGNIVGGAFFVGCIYWFVYLRDQAKKDNIASKAIVSEKAS